MIITRDYAPLGAKSIIQLDMTVLMLHSPWKDRLSLICQMLQSGKYCLIFFNQLQKKIYLHQKKIHKSSSKSLLHGSCSTIISSLQPLSETSLCRAAFGFASGFSKLLLKIVRHQQTNLFHEWLFWLYEKLEIYNKTCFNLLQHKH